MRGDDITEEPFKIGTHVRGEGIVEFQYENVFQRQDGTIPPRIVVAPAAKHVDLLIRLTREMPPPYWVLYILMVPHTESVQPGRYQLMEEFDEDGIRRLLSSFQEFFEGDARHHLWIGSRKDRSLLVYDQHNVIYAYGPVDQFASILQAQGLREDEVVYPYPHTHHFRTSLDRFEAELLDRYEWAWSPLEEEDDD
ncbi:MAG: hypothetical protein ACAH95_07880 [Fimbriimonas sp.]